MAPRTAFLLLALLGAVISLQGVVLAEDASTSVAGASVENSLDEQRNAAQGEADSFDEDAGDSESSGTEVADVDGEEQPEDALSPSHPLARILKEQSSKTCWSKEKCKTHFKNPGCCSGRCVNLSKDNKNCGGCETRCDTKKGHCCQSGKCHEVKKSGSKVQCIKTKDCEKGLSCCDPGKCVNLETNNGNCGRCGNRCGRGTVCCKGMCLDLTTNTHHCGKWNKRCDSGCDCCKGKCIHIKHDWRNCGRCGNRCKYGKKCCNGYCKNVFGNDGQHCGACGKKCHTSCRLGMCGYGVK